MVQNQTNDSTQKAAETQPISDADWVSSYVSELWRQRQPQASENSSVNAKEKEQPLIEEKLDPKENELRTASNIALAAKRWEKLVGEGLGETPIAGVVGQFGRQILTEKFDAKKIGELIKDAKVTDLEASKKGIERLNQYLHDYGYKLDVGITEGGQITHIGLSELERKGTFSVGLKVNAQGETFPTREKKVENGNTERKGVSAKDATKYISSTFFDSVCP